jgi:hypothetical protein
MPSLPLSVTSARRAAADDDRGEGVISAGIVVLIMAAIGLAMWVAFNAMWQDVETKTKANVDQIGTPTGS